MKVCQTIFAHGKPSRCGVARPCLAVGNYGFGVRALSCLVIQAFLFNLNGSKEPVQKKDYRLMPVSRSVMVSQAALKVSGVATIVTDSLARVMPV